MAYDLLSRRQTPADWSMTTRRSPRRGSFRGSWFFAEYVFAPDPLPTTPVEKELIAHLAVLKMRVDSGDKKALPEWRKNMKAILAARERAKKGDPKAKRFVQVLSESGLFDGVQKMEVADSLAEGPTSPKL